MRITRRGVVTAGVAWVVGVWVGWGGCDSRPAPRAPGPVRIVVSVAPLTGLAQALAPSDAEVITLVPPGRSLHGYEMTPADLAWLGRADVILYVGLGLDRPVEAFLSRHGRAGREVVCFAEVLGIADSGAADHDHGHEHDHGIDPHLWLDPSLVERLIPHLSRAILSAAARAGEENLSALEAAAARLVEEVRRVDEEYLAALGPLRGASLVTHHNAFSRLAERYGLRIAAVLRPLEGVEPSPGDVVAAARAAREEGARAIFVEPQYDVRAARRLAEECGLAVGTLDPEGQTDWFALMRFNLAELVRLLSQAGG